VALVGFHLCQWPAAGGATVRVTEHLIAASGNIVEAASCMPEDQPGNGSFVCQLELVAQGRELMRQGQVEVEVEPAQESKLHPPLLNHE
jgi:hypothetical protein